MTTSKTTVPDTCKHMSHLHEHGIKLCTACHDPAHCNTCEHHEPINKENKNNTPNEPVQENTQNF